MKTGLSLSQLAKELDRRSKAKVDFVAPVSKFAVAVDRNAAKQLVPTIRLAAAEGVKVFGINKVAHEQFSDYAGIPMQYYRRMLEQDPQLLVQNVNRWLQDHKDERRMVRVLDGNVRALLSDKFRALENEDLAEAIIPVLQERDLVIASCEVTDQRLYIKAVDRNMEDRIPKGHKFGDGSHVGFDMVSPGVAVSNSEVGRGSLMIESTIFTHGCTNKAIFGTTLRKFHTGARAEMSDDVYQMLSDKTKRLTDAAVWAQTRDLVAGASHEAKFRATTDMLKAATEDRLAKKADVVEVVERVGRKFGLGDGERKGVLQCLIEDGDLSRYGVHSAITRFSQDDSVNYDRATELERLGARVIELKKNEWEALAKAA